MNRLYVIISVVIISCILVFLYLKSSKKPIKTETAQTRFAKTVKALNSGVIENFYEGVIIDHHLTSEIIDKFNKNTTYTTIFDTIKPSIDYFIKDEDQKKCVPNPVNNIDKYVNLKRSCFIIAKSPKLDVNNKESMINFGIPLISVIMSSNGFYSSENSNTVSSLEIINDSSGQPEFVVTNNRDIKGLLTIIFSFIPFTMRNLNSSDSSFMNSLLNECCTCIVDNGFSDQTIKQLLSLNASTPCVYISNSQPDTSTNCMTNLENISQIISGIRDFISNPTKSLKISILLVSKCLYVLTKMENFHENECRVP